MEKEYLSIKNLAKKYDIHPDTIRKKPTKEGVHYVKIGKLIRYNVKEMHKLLTGQTTTQINLDNFLIDSVQY